MSVAEHKVFSVVIMTMMVILVIAVFIFFNFSMTSLSERVCFFEPLLCLWQLGPKMLEVN